MKNKLMYAVIALQILTLYLIADTRAQLVEIFSLTADSIQSIMTNLQSRSIDPTYF